MIFPGVGTLSMVLLFAAGPASPVVAPSPSVTQPQGAGPPPNVDDEASRLSAALRQELPHVITDPPQRAEVDRAHQTMLVKHRFRIDQRNCWSSSTATPGRSRCGC